MMITYFIISGEVWSTQIKTSQGGGEVYTGFPSHTHKRLFSATLQSRKEKELKKTN